MIQQIQKIWDEWNMVSPGDVVLTGVSGGADSVCLLLVLKQMALEKGFSLEAIHVEHGIRGEESRQDALFVKRLCEVEQVPLTIITVDVPGYSKETGMGLEEAARVLRYQAFSKVAMEKKAKIALAHHMEDNAETILFQMLRGSGIVGLCGMQPMRRDENGICYIRPLLRVHREEIEAYLQTKGQNYCVDSTNAELEYSRNFIRNRILPQLTKVNEQAVEHINSTAEHLMDIRAWMEQEIEEAWERVVHTSSYGKGQELVLDMRSCARLHIALQKELILKAIATVGDGKKDVTSGHVEDVLGLMNKQSGKEVTLPHGVIARKEYDAIRFFRKEPMGGLHPEQLWVNEETLEAIRGSKEPFVIPLKKDGESIVVRVFSLEDGMAEIPKKTYTKWLDYDKMKKGFCIRTRCSGDYFISDAFGHHKKLKQYFIDEKIKVTDRERMWLLAQGPLVLWLVGGRISEHLKVTAKTNTIVEITYNGGNE